MTVHKHPAAPADKPAPYEFPRSTRLERALADAMKAQEGPELLAKIATREFKDAFQAIAVQQRGYSSDIHYEASAVPVVQMNYDPDFPDDKSKQLYQCRMGAAVLTPEIAKSLQAGAEKAGIRFVATPKAEFTNSTWFKAVVILMYSTDLQQIVKLVNDEMIEKIRPDARVLWDDIIRIAQEEIGKILFE